MLYIELARCFFKQDGCIKCELYSAWVCSGKVPKIDQFFFSISIKIPWNIMQNSFILCVGCFYGSWVALDASSGTWCKCPLPMLSGLPALVLLCSLERGQGTLPQCTWCSYWILLINNLDSGAIIKKSCRSFWSYLVCHKPGLYRWW